MRKTIVAGNWKMNKTPAEAIALIEELKPLVADNTETEVVFCPPFVDLVLVMSVEPGFGGQKFIPESLDRIRAIREEANRNNPMLRIEVDGGIKVNNVKTVLDAGADTIVAGSAVLGGDDAMEKARAFMEILA